MYVLIWRINCKTSDGSKFMEKPGFTRLDHGGIQPGNSFWSLRIFSCCGWEIFENWEHILWRFAKYWWMGVSGRGSPEKSFRFPFQASLTVQNWLSHSYVMKIMSSQRKRLRPTETVYRTYVRTQNVQNGELFLRILHPREWPGQSSRETWIWANQRWKKFNLVTVGTIWFVTNPVTLGSPKKLSIAVEPSAITAIIEVFEADCFYYDIYLYIWFLKFQNGHPICYILSFGLYVFVCLSSTQFSFCVFVIHFVTHRFQTDVFMVKTISWWFEFTPVGILNKIISSIDLLLNVIYIAISHYHLPTWLFKLLNSVRLVTINFIHELPMSFLFNWHRN